MKTLHFFFDYSSPFAYLGSTQIREIAAETETDLIYQPFLLGGLFKAIGTPMVPLHSFNPPKKRYYERDLQMWAAHWNVPLITPTLFPINTVAPLRLTLVALREAKAEVHQLVSEIFTAYWVENQDISQPEVLGALLEKLALPAQWLTSISTPEIKEELRLKTSNAVERGVCGAPSFEVDGQLFWGQDRLDFVTKALRGS